MPNRQTRLLPNGKPKYVRVYDNGGESIDHYTVVFSGNYPGRNGECTYLSMNGAPFHPQGFCQHGAARFIIDAPQGWAPAIGRKCHLGIRIPFATLPDDCQTVVLRDYKELWKLS